MPEKGWLPYVVHPQSMGICYGAFSFWPDSGFLGPDLFDQPELVLWPVPRLKGARLVECRCGLTGLQPQTMEDLARYIPGARLEGNRLVLENNPLLKYPDGSGEDEVDGTG